MAEESAAALTRLIRARRRVLLPVSVSVSVQDSRETPEQNPRDVTDTDTVTVTVSTPFGNTEKVALPWQLSHMKLTREAVSCVIRQQSPMIAAFLKQYPQFSLATTSGDESDSSASHMFLPVDARTSHFVLRASLDVLVVAHDAATPAVPLSIAVTPNMKIADVLQKLAHPPFSLLQPVVADSARALAFLSQEQKQLVTDAPQRLESTRSVLDALNLRLPLVVQQAATSTALSSATPAALTTTSDAKTLDQLAAQASNSAEWLDASARALAAYFAGGRRPAAELRAALRMDTASFFPDRLQRHNRRRNRRNNAKKAEMCVKVDDNSCATTLALRFMEQSTAAATASATDNDSSSSDHASGPVDMCIDADAASDRNDDDSELLEWNASDDDEDESNDASPAASGAASTMRIDSPWQLIEVMSSRDTAIRLLRKEVSLRLSKEQQSKYAASHDGSGPDWMNLTDQLQRRMLQQEFVLANPELLQMAVTMYRSYGSMFKSDPEVTNIAFYIKYNRARQPDIRVGDVARDVPLVSMQQQMLQLGQFWREKPLFVIAASFTCPPFRGMLNELEQLYLRYGRAVNFLTVYILEAHASDEWPIGSIEVEQTRTFEARRAIAQRFLDSTDGKYTMPFVLDTAPQDDFETVYASWPIRFYTFSAASAEPDGQARVRYIAQPKQGSYSLEEIERELQRVAGLPQVTQPVVAESLLAMSS